MICRNSKSGTSPQASTPAQGWYADGVYWSTPGDPDPDAEPVDISRWPTVEPADDIPPALRARPRGVIITDSPIPPFPATYETRP